MRLTQHQVQLIRDIADEIVGESSHVRVFGSRLDDTARGGDIDLLLELTESTDNPALIAAQFSARVSRAMGGQKVDVLVIAPNLMCLPIHDVALAQGQLI
jgi:predicted nucleotidyltransferase